MTGIFVGVMMLVMGEDTRYLSALFTSLGACERSQVAVAAELKKRYPAAEITGTCQALRFGPVGRSA